MKKWMVCLLTAVLLVALAAAAQGMNAAEITDRCEIMLGKNKRSTQMTDRKYGSAQETKKELNPTLTIRSKEPVYGLYVCFKTVPEQYEIQARRGGTWETVTEGDPSFAHAYYEIPGDTEIRVYAAGDRKQAMGISEVFVFGEGDAPEWVQRWKKTPDKTDILFVVAHPEEELLYLGGAIPTYACEKRRSVAFACLSYVNPARRSEFLNGLWSMGYRYYPDFGGFALSRATSVKGAYKDVDPKTGQGQVLAWLTGVIRRYRPEVIVGPDADGEGKNGQRMMLADACRQCFELAPDESYTGGGVGMNVWQPKKLYLHLYGDEKNRTTLDWEKPLESMNGRRSIDIATYAYLYHKSQSNTRKSVQVTGKKYANNSYGLCETTVGDDTARNDFLEHIEPGAPVEPDRAPDPLADVLPELNERGFLDEGEFIWADDMHGHYVFINQTEKVIVTRKFDGALPLTWFESEIWCDVENGSLMRNFEYTPEKAVGKKSAVDAAVNARKNKVAFAVNGDYYTYRLASKLGNPCGIEIREGMVYADSAYAPGDPDERVYFPNMDTLAFYRDGSVNVHHSSEQNAQAYLDQDAYMVLSFGPYLIRDGEYSEWAMDMSRTQAKNPRHCFGMVEPGHYVDIMCEGRLGSRSEGVTMPQLAMLASAAGLKEACNLDGGQTAVVIFMGKQLNKIGQYDGKVNSRPTSEVMGVGVTDRMDSFEWE